MLERLGNGTRHVQHSRLGATDLPILLASDTGTRHFEKTVGTVITRDFDVDAGTTSDRVAVLAKEEIGQRIMWRSELWRGRRETRDVWTVDEHVGRHVET
jgi:hypothetical protein